MRRALFFPFGFGLLAALTVLAQSAELPAKLKPFDSDGDGKLSAAEFPDKELFGKLDTNRDGFVTVAEIRDYYRQNPPPPARKSGAATSAPAAPQTRRSPEESFGYLDRDVDGSLSESEFEQLSD